MIMESSEGPGSREHFRAGYVALLGRPNVGKSTLLNALVGQKVSITARKPQTTRFQILGIHTETDRQVVYIDTPGLHASARKAINRYLNKAASSVLPFADVILLVVEAGRWTEDDDLVMETVGQCPAPVVVAVNKIDRLRDREALIPILQELAVRLPEAELVPVSALRRKNLSTLERLIAQALPEGPPLFPEDQVTDRGLRFFAAELVREKLFRELHAELPYSIAVDVESFEERPHRIDCSVVVWIDKESQKPIVIGRGGERLKRVGQAARLELEAMAGKQVRLEIWVKRKDDWSNDERALQLFGYTLQ
jgi:GTP-binding protein Era